MAQPTYRPSEFNLSGLIKKVAVEGYGPPDLVERVSEAPWTVCIPEGKNFSGIVLGEWVLTDTPDALCSEKYRVTLETVPRGAKCTVEGYQSRYLLDAIQTDSHPITFAGCCLLDDYSGEVKAYRATIERIS
jgi:hypothetical protein